MDSHLQVSAEIFDEVQVRFLAGSLKDIHSYVVLAMFRGIVVLEDEPSSQAEVLSTLGQFFTEDISGLCSVQLFFNLTSLPVPATEKYLHSMMVPPPCFTGRMVLGI